MNCRKMMHDASSLAERANQLVEDDTLMFLNHNSAIRCIIAGCLVFGLAIRVHSSTQDPPPQSSQPAAVTAPPATSATPQTHKATPRKRKTPAANPTCATSNAAPDSPAEAPTDCPPVKVVVRNGGASERSLRLSGANDDTHDPHRGQSTDQLLQSTGRNLQQLSSRQLAPAEKEMVDQILRYSEQSRAAVAAGNVELGHNFALKAHLLSDELLTH